MSTKRIEYAAAEPGYENDPGVEWETDRSKAQREVDYDRELGVVSYLIERTVTISKWREAR